MGDMEKIRWVRVGGPLSVLQQVLAAKRVFWGHHWKEYRQRLVCAGNCRVFNMCIEWNTVAVHNHLQQSIQRIDVLIQSTSIFLFCTAFENRFVTNNFTAILFKKLKNAYFHMKSFKST